MSLLLRGPGSGFHDHGDAMKWAHLWSIAWNTRYHVRWIKATAVWHAYPTDKPAPKRKAA